MAKRGTDTGNTLPGVVGATGVIAAYVREHLNSGRSFTSTALVDLLREPWKEIRNASVGYELLLAFAVIPIVLISIEATIQTKQLVLPLTAEPITQPETAVLAFTSSFVHAGSAHLRGNVIGYLLIMSALYPLAVRTGKKRELAGVAVFNLLAVPLITGQISLLLPITGSTQGFSAVNAAFLGTLILFIFFAWNADTGEVNPVWSVGPTLASLALAFTVAPFVFPYTPPLGKYVLVFGLLGGLLAVYFFHSKGQSALRQFWLQAHPICYWAVGVLIVGYAKYHIFIPENANLAAHLGGFYLGFFGLFALVIGRESRKRARLMQHLGERL